MKKLFVLILFMFSFSFTTEKTYSFKFTEKETSDIFRGLGYIYQVIDKSSIPHDQANNSLSLIRQIIEKMENQKNNQLDSVKKKSK